MRVPPTTRPTAHGPRPGDRGDASYAPATAIMGAVERHGDGGTANSPDGGTANSPDEGPPAAPPGQLPPRPPARSRRQVLAAAAAASLGALLAACSKGAASATGPGGHTRPRTLRHFRSRPDLTPPVVGVTTGRPSGTPTTAGTPTSTPTPLATPTPTATPDGASTAAGTPAHPAGVAPGYVFVTPGGPLILDDVGGPVWIHPVDDASMNFGVQRYQGQPVLTWWQGHITSFGMGTDGHGILMDASYREVARVQPGNGLPSDHHELLLTDRGTAYLTTYAIVEADLTPAGGPRRGRLLDSIFQEVDVATGEVVMEWRCSDHLEVAETMARYPAHPSTSTSLPLFDAFHLNSIDPMPDGSLLVSARNTWALYKIDPATGEVLWRLGGRRSDLSLGKGVRFAWQHDARAHPGGVVSVFDNEAGPPAGPQSRGLVLQVHEAARHVSLTRSYTHPKRRLLAGSQGSVQLLADGNVLVGWGPEPYTTEFHHDGSVALDLRFEGGESYRAFKFPWTGRPTEAPAVAVEPAVGGGITAYASWNGATEVATWQALAGPDKRRLAVVGSAKRSGFETAVTTGLLAPGTSWAAARALDASGAVLATSAPVPVPPGAP